VLNERTIELIHLRIDGQASPSEESELAAILDSSAEARATLEDLGKVAMTLESAPLVQAPATLKKDVLAGIRQKRPSRFQWTRPQRRRIFGSATNFPTNRAVLTTEPGTDGLTDGWRQRMNSQKKRNFLIAFGGVAVVLVAVVATWPPAFLSEDASGAIGVVQKHRAPQITASDVVLADEQTRGEANILYADFLKDAATLQNISVELNAALSESDQALEARAIKARNALMGHEADLQARYASNFANTLDAMKKAMAESDITLEARKKIESDIEELSVRMRNAADMQGSDMDTLNARLENIDAQFQAKAAAVRKFANVDQLQSDLEGLEARKSIGNEDAQNLSARIESISRDLQGIRIDARSQIAYLNTLALEAKSAQQLLGKRASIDGFSAKLASDAEMLEAKATNNLQARLSSEAEMAAKLRDIESVLGSARQFVESRKVTALSASLKDAEQAFGARKADFQARLAGRIQHELAVIDNYLESRTQFAARLASDDQLEARRLRSGEAQAVESKALGSRLANEQELESRRATLGGVPCCAFKASSVLEAKLAAREDLRAKIANVSGFQKHLANLDQALAGNRAFASLAQRDRLEMQARELGKRAQLQARSDR